MIFFIEFSINITIYINLTNAYYAILYSILVNCSGEDFAAGSRYNVAVVVSASEVSNISAASPLLTSKYGYLPSILVPRPGRGRVYSAIATITMTSISPSIDGPLRLPWRIQHRHYLLLPPESRETESLDWAG